MIYKGTTPTFTLTFPDGTDFSSASAIYVTFSKIDHTVIMTKETDDVTVSDNVLSVYLTQEETLALPDSTLIQVNWLYDDNGTTKRACSDIEMIEGKTNLINEVLE